MGTEKFFAFNESGTLKRLKGRILRYLESEDPDNDDKVAIRASLSVPASAEGLTPANNLSDVSSAETSRSNLGVNSIAQDAESRINDRPALWFDGDSGYASIAAASGSPLGFTDGTYDKPFSLEIWAKPEDLTNCPLIARYSPTSGLRSYRLQFDAADNLQFMLSDASDVVVKVEGDNAFTNNEGEIMHIVATYEGGGGTVNPYSTTANRMALYVNNELIDQTATNDGSFTGMPDTSQDVWIGKQGSVIGQSTIWRVRVHNKALSASEIDDLFRSGPSRFLSDAVATNILTDNPDFETDTASPPSGWSHNGNQVATAVADGTAPSGSNVCEIVASGAGSWSANAVYNTTDTGTRRDGRNYKVRFKAKSISGSTSLTVGGSFSTTQTITTSWEPYETDLIAGGAAGVLTVAFFLNAAGTVRIDDIEVLEDGCILDLDASNVAGTTWIDRSRNGYNGTLNSMTVDINSINLPPVVSVNSPNPSSGQALLNLANAGDEKFHVNDQGNVKILKIGDQSELTIASGVITPTTSYHTVDTESDAASDDLDTITAGLAGQMIVISANNAARSVVVKDGTGNLKISGDCTLDNDEDTITLICDGTNWKEICRSNKGS